MVALEIIYFFGLWMFRFSEIGLKVTKFFHTIPIRFWKPWKKEKHLNIEVLKIISIKELIQTNV